MRRRPSARLLLLDEEARVLLFRFVFKTGALAGEDFWATPGGAMEEGETFAETARRELFEETGLIVETLEEHVAEREFVLHMSDGEDVLAHERFFVVRVTQQTINCDHWTDLEKEVMVDHRWWSVPELKLTTEVVYPENLAEILERQICAK